MFSYWEQQSFVGYDHIIIGSGIVGLSVAAELRSRFPTDSIMVLERGLMPTGATSRNAGFACMGSVTELLDDLTRMTEQEVATLFATRKEGLELLRQRLGDANIGYESNGSFELLDANNERALDHLGYLNDLLRPLAGRDAFRPANHLLGQFGFSGQVTALIENTLEGALHSGKMLRALTNYVLSRGIEIKTGAAVTHFEEHRDYVSVFIPDQLRGDDWILRCRSLCLCTNAFTKQLLPLEEVVPGRGQVLITQPVPGLQLKGIFHMDSGYFYFRELDGRILLGGGRNLDFDGETTTELELNDMIQQELDRRLRTIILPGVNVEVAQRWSGIMAFGSKKIPAVKAVSNRVFGAFRMGGMGVALGSKVARDIADIIWEQTR